MKIKDLITLCLLLTFHSVSCTPNNVSDVPKENALTLSIAPLMDAAASAPQNMLFLEWDSQTTIAINGEKAVVNPLIDASEALVATFTLPKGITEPYTITYPYTEGTSAQKPLVVFPAEQEIAPDKFNQLSMPACSVVESGQNSGTLHHLAGVTRLMLVSAEASTPLDRIVITSKDESTLAGTFMVDCNYEAMIATDNTSTQATYKLPKGYTLSADKPAEFHLALPYGDHGRCEVEIFDTNGSSTLLNVKEFSVNKGDIKTLGEFPFSPHSTINVDEWNSSTPVMPFHKKVYGYVKDTAGNPIEGVAVSDGYTVVATNAEGYYTLDVSPDTWYIYYSTPAEYEVAINEFGQPCFWQSYPAKSARMDFTLTPLPGGKEQKFAFFTFADPQVYSNNNLNRFLNEAVPGIAAHAGSLNIPKYGITLGDIVFNTDNFKCSHHMPSMRDGFSKSKVNMPVFQIMGNHDQNEFNASAPLVADERSSDINIKAQRDFESVFGPVNYSFNRGDVHIVGMRNVIFTSATSNNGYQLGFTDKQYEWLKQDLALVPKDKMIYFCVHIPLYDNKSSNITALKTGTNIQEVLALLKNYKEVHIMSGHEHTQRNFTNSLGIREHNIASVAGAWWTACVCGDGCPNGFNVFIAEGNNLVDDYFYGYTASSSTRNHQMRLYRGNAVTGAAISGDNKNNTKGYYGFNFSDDTILANVYNANSDWKISVYEDGVYSGDMTLAPSSQPAIGSLVGDYSYENPRRAADGVLTGHDYWVTGYMMGALGRTTSNGGYQVCHHMYHYKLKNKNASIKVIATDTWGNTYEESTITVGTDYTAAVKP